MATTQEEIEAVVIDNGTWMCKAGYSWGKTAQAYERTVVGKGRGDECPSPPAPSEFVGERAWLHRATLELTCSMHRGVVTDWDVMESFWDYIFRRGLRSGIAERPMLITEIPGNPEGNRRRLVEIMFETFDVSSLYVSNPAFLALIASGRTTGVVLDVGGGVAHTALVIKGSEVPQCSRKSNIGGNDVTDWLLATLRNNGALHPGNSPKGDWEEADIFKTHITSLNASKEATPSANEYSFADGSRVQLNEQYATCSDVLFNPQMAGSEASSVDQILFETISCCPREWLPEICANIILMGGATMTTDIGEKMAKSLEKRGLKRDLRIIAPPERRKSSWLGGAILSSLEEFPLLCKSREMYKEHGWRCCLTFEESKTVTKADT